MTAVECHADITLVQSLTSLPRDRIAYFFRGRSGVCKQLQNSSGSTGMIDEDPDSAARHAYEMAGETDNSYIKSDIKYRYYPGDNNRLILLCPRLEDWVIKTARIADLDLVQHGLPDDPVNLHHVIDQKLSEFRVIISLLRKNRSERLENLAYLLNL